MRGPIVLPFGVLVLAAVIGATVVGGAIVLRVDAWIRRRRWARQRRRRPGYMSLRDLPDDRRRG